MCQGTSAIDPQVIGAGDGLRFPRDPADRLIVATSRAMGIPVLSHDHLINRSRLVTRWRPTA